MKGEEEIDKQIKLCEAYILADKDYSDLRGFEFYGEVNTKLTKVHGIRKILLWVLGKQPRDSRRLNKEYEEEK